MKKLDLIIANKSNKEKLKSIFNSKPLELTVTRLTDVQPFRTKKITKLIRTY